MGFFGGWGQEWYDILSRLKSDKYFIFGLAEKYKNKWNRFFNQRKKGRKVKCMFWIELKVSFDLALPKQSAGARIKKGSARCTSLYEKYQTRINWKFWFFGGKDWMIFVLVTWGPGRPQQREWHSSRHMEVVGTPTLIGGHRDSPLG